METSVRPNVNEPFLNSNGAEEFLSKWEVENREIFVKHKEIVKRLGLSPGQTVADVGAGTGLFMEELHKSISPKGKLICVDLAPKFIDYLKNRRTTLKLSEEEVEVRQCTEHSVQLEPNSVDLVFLCDAYHHLEYPQSYLKTTKSIWTALKDDGVFAVIDFERIEGKSTEWVLNHVRANKETVWSEITSASFTLDQEEKGFFNENWFAFFKKVQH